MEGRSSATPSNVACRLERKKPAHFPAVEVGFRFDHHLPNRVHAAAKTTPRERRSSGTDHHGVGGGKFLAGRPLCDHAGSHSFVLRAKYIPSTTAQNWVNFWRNHVTRASPRRNQTPIWQRDYWDRQLRRHESYAQKWKYVAHAEDWRFKGELNVLSWHD